MKDRGIKTGQYAYTKDGDIIRIDEICEDNKKYMGRSITRSGYPLFIFNESDIYGIAGKVYKAERRKNKQ